VDRERLLKRLGFGARFWNLRREEDPDTSIVLDGAKLDGLILTGLDGANLRQADFRGARLANAHYSPADLEGALNLPGEVR
jgi:hypothetical protein